MVVHAHPMQLSAVHHAASLHRPLCQHHRPLPRRLQRCSAAECVVERVTSAEDFDRVGEIRAAAFYEEKQGQYQQSYQRQFAQKESSNWQRNVRADPGGLNARCMGAFVDGTVQACLDIIRQAPDNLAEGSAPSAYVKNVAVHRSHRRRKLAVQLLEASQQAAARDWQARTAFAHVERDNEAARQLYLKCGYQPAEGDGSHMPAAVASERVPSQGPTDLMYLML